MLNFRFREGVETVAGNVQHGLDLLLLILIQQPVDVSEMVAQLIVVESVDYESVGAVVLYSRRRQNFVDADVWSLRDDPQLVVVVADQLYELVDIWSNRVGKDHETRKPHLAFEAGDECLVDVCERHRNVDFRSHRKG